MEDVVDRELKPKLRECYREGCVRKHCPECGGHLERESEDSKRFWCDFCKKYFDEVEVED
ncbi:MAG: hypothetical protein ACLFVL_01785 [Candidatus Aenigmatarchaeota archaeon]